MNILQRIFNYFKKGFVMSEKVTKKEVIKIARKHKIKITEGSPETERSKDDLIKAIQYAEGNNACYRTNVMACKQHGCAWYKECQK